MSLLREGVGDDELTQQTCAPGHNMLEALVVINTTQHAHPRHGKHNGMLGLPNRMSVNAARGRGGTVAGG
jgi:hypothetical protein